MSSAEFYGKRLRSYDLMTLADIEHWLDWILRWQERWSTRGLHKMAATESNARIVTRKVV